MTKEINSNCIGFVYHHFGIIDEEQFIKPRTIRKTIEPYFKFVEKLEDANAFAIVSRGSENYQSVVRHMGILTDDVPRMVIHRPGAHENIIKETISSSTDQYIDDLKDGNALFLFLKSYDPPHNPVPDIPRSKFSRLPYFLRKFYIRFFTTEVDL